MKKLPESISQELNLLKQNTLEKFRLPAGSLDDVFSLFMQSQAEVLRLKEELTLMRIQLFGKRSEKQATNEERYHARQEQSLPILHKLKTWLDETLLHATAKNKLGVALGYLASNWSKLVRYTEAGYLPIDNNPVEGDIRHFAVGRKNWLFSDTPAGAHSSAIIYSLMQTAMANGKEPYAWMRYVMEQLPTCESAEQIEQLLPWNCEPPIYR